MSSLYQITEELVALDKMLAQLGGDVSEGSEGEGLDKWIEKYEWLQREKIDAYCGFIRSMEADMEAIAAEEKRLNDRKRVLFNRVERMKAMAKFAMESRQVRKIEGLKFTVAIQKNGGKAPLVLLVDDPAKVDERFVKRDPVIDKTALRAALESGDKEAAALAGKYAQIGEAGESVRIR